MKTFGIHLLNIPINLQYSNLICLNISASSLLSLLNMNKVPFFWIEDFIEINKDNKHTTVTTHIQNTLLT